MQKALSRIHSVEPLPSSYELKSQLPITLAQMRFVEKSRDEIIRILNSDDKRHLLIVGPCHSRP